MNLKSKDGFTVKLEELEIELSLLSYLEGDLIYVREKILQEDIPRRFQKRNCGLLVKVPPPGPLPEYIIIASLRSRVVSKEEHWDYSVLALIWFLDELPVNLPQALQEQVQEVDWVAHAKDVSC